MLYDVRHEPDNPEHPNVHVAALFDGAIQFALEAIDAWDVGNDADAARRTSWVGAVLVDLADSVRWGTGTPGRHISAIIMHLAISRPCTSCGSLSAVSMCRGGPWPNDAPPRPIVAPRGNQCDYLV